MASDDDLLDLGEDLFDFDELLRDAQLFDALALPGEPAAGSGREDQPAPLPGRAPPPPAFRPHRRPPPVADRRRAPVPGAPAPAPEAGAPSIPSQAASPTPAAPRRLAIGRGLALVLALAALVHLGLVGFAIHALRSVQGMVDEVGGRMLSTTETVRDVTADLARSLEGSSQAIVSPRSEGATALERARGLVADGEYPRARETLYALLAVADRLEASTRRDIEGQARFLIADTWRLEAAQLAGSSMAGAPREEGRR